MRESTVDKVKIDHVRGKRGDERLGNGRDIGELGERKLGGAVG